MQRRVRRYAAYLQVTHEHLTHCYAFISGTEQQFGANIAPGVRLRSLDCAMLGVISALNFPKQSLLMSMFSLLWMSLKGVETVSSFFLPNKGSHCELQV